MLQSRFGKKHFPFWVFEALHAVGVPCTAEYSSVCLHSCVPMTHVRYCRRSQHQLPLGSISPRDSAHKDPTDHSPLSEGMGNFKSAAIPVQTTPTPSIAPHHVVVELLYGGRLKPLITAHHPEAELCVPWLLWWTNLVKPRAR